MTYWSTIVNAGKLHCVVVSDYMFISILSVSVKPLEMSWAEAAVTLAPRART